MIALEHIPGYEVIHWTGKTLLPNGRSRFVVPKGSPMIHLRGCKITKRARDGKVESVPESLVRMLASDDIPFRFCRSCLLHRSSEGRLYRKL